MDAVDAVEAVERVRSVDARKVSAPKPTPSADAVDMRRRFIAGLWMGAIGAVLFSGKAVIVKLAYRYGVDATTLIGLRMLYAAPLFAIVAWLVSDRRGERALGPRAQWQPHDAWRIVGIGLVGYYLSSYLDFLGLRHISAGLERVILYLSPTIVLLISFVIWRRPVSRAQWGALALCYCGMLAVLGADLRQQPGAEILLGSVLVFGSAISYATYMVASGQIVRRLGALRLTSLATLVACAACITQALLMRGDVLWQQPWQVHALSVVNAVACTFIPMCLTMMAIERLGAGVSAQVGMVGPASTIVLAAIFLSEPITATQLGGTALVLGGALLLSRAAPGRR